MDNNSGLKILCVFVKMLFPSGFFYLLKRNYFITYIILKLYYKHKLLKILNNFQLNTINEFFPEPGR